MPSRKGPGQVSQGGLKPPGLRARLLATVLACSLLTTGAASLFFLNTSFREARRAHRQGIESLLDGIEFLLQEEGASNLEAALTLVRHHPDLIELELLDRTGSAPLLWSTPRRPSGQPHTGPLKYLERTPPAGRLRAAYAPLSTQALARRLTPPLLIWAASSLALFCLGLWPALTFLVIRPLRRLVAQARGLARGDLDNRLEERGGQEILDLARALNSLGAALIEKERGARANLLALRFAFNQLRKVLDSLAEGVLVTDQALDLVLVNPAAQTFLGLEESEVIGTSMTDCFPASDQEQVWSIASSFQSGSPGPALLDVRIKGRTLRCSLAPLHSETQPFAGLVAVLMDMSRERELEEMKETILSSVSHELRTPLTSILSYTEILRTMPPDDKETEQEFLDIIGTEVDRLARLVDHLLDLSNLAAGKNILHRLPVPLADLLDHARTRFQTQADEAGIQLHCAPPTPDLPSTLLLDRNRIQQILDHLVGNALKFTPRNGHIHLTTRQLPSRENPTGSLLFTIADTGPGIPLAQREAIFEQFIQLGEVMREKPSGAGLGLSLARIIAEAHGGRIWCGPNPGGGARFYLQIPLTLPAPVA